MISIYTIVRTQCVVTEDFPIPIGLHQELTLNPYLLTIVLDVLMQHIQEVAPRRCMSFVDDMVLLEESREKLNERLETSLRSVC